MALSRDILLRAPVGLFVAFFLLAACASSPATDGVAPAVCAASPLVAGDGFSLQDSCGGALTLRPVVRVGGAWQRAAAGTCSAAAGAVRCEIGGAGALTLAAQGHDLKVSLAATAAVSVQGLGIEILGALPGATSWVSSGFQSWSQSGTLALGPAPTDAELQAELNRRGDDEVLRDGRWFSWTHTQVTGGKMSLLVGALSAAQFRPWVAVSAAPDLRLVAASGGSGEEIAVPAGGQLDGETFRVELGAEPNEVLRRYGAALPSRRATRQPRAQAGWNSWYQLWDTVDEKAVRENAALARQILGPSLPTDAPPLRIVVDDGWQKAWGDWEPNEKFPAGLDGLARDLTGQGFTLGVWLAPLLAAEQSQVYKDHPGWFLPDATYKHAKNGLMHVLDVTNPEAAAHLTAVIQTIASWGYTLLKIDFLFAGTYEAQRAAPATGMAAYNKALRVIRDAAGDGVTLVAVGAPALPSIAYTEGWRVGPDIALENTDVAWPYIPNQARTLAARWPFCLATLCDADPAILRKLGDPEIGAGAWVAAFGGGAFFLSDDLRALPAGRSALGVDAARVAAGLSGTPSIPLDPTPATPPASLVNVVGDLLSHQNTHVVPQLWQTPSGKKISLNSTDVAITSEGTPTAPHSAATLP